MVMGLSHQDFDLLIDAVEVWERELSSQRFHVSLFGIAAASSKEEADHAVAKVNNLSLSQKQTERIRKERATLVKAKLITLRDAAIADTAFQESQ